MELQLANDPKSSTISTPCGGARRSSDTQSEGDSRMRRARDWHEDIRKDAYGTSKARVGVAKGAATSSGSSSKSMPLLLPRTRASKPGRPFGDDARAGAIAQR